MNEEIVSPEFALAVRPEDQPHVFAAAFNTGDADAIERVYEPGGVFVREPGSGVAGTERRAANARMAALGLPIEVRPRHTYVAGDIALLIVDWSISGETPDGAVVDIAGTATDVARRGEDGVWRYVIDNPFGVAPVSPNDSPPAPPSA